MRPPYISERSFLLPIESPTVVENQPQCCTMNLRCTSLDVENFYGVIDLRCLRLEGLSALSTTF